MNKRSQTEAEQCQAYLPKILGKQSEAIEIIFLFTIYLNTQINSTTSSNPFNANSINVKFVKLLREFGNISIKIVWFLVCVNYD